MIRVKEFRLPKEEGRKTMTIEELIDTRDQFFRWVCMNEEGMTFEDYDKMMAKLSKFEDYIEKRMKEEGRTN